MAMVMDMGTNMDTDTGMGTDTGMDMDTDMDQVMVITLLSMVLVRQEEIESDQD